ncbi:MAG: DJ-1/PfpI family protein [Lachnospiraceae bacterium]|nr:DJ-1/PfpI family protein [Candidatus Equihabitans merdae]
MKKAYLFIANGSEEVEALTVVDLLRRADVDVNIVSIEESAAIEGSNGIRITADSLFADNDYADADLVVLPGGLPGTLHLKGHEALGELLKAKAADDKTIVSAICAAPTVLGYHGILADKKATCYPGCEGDLNAAQALTDKVVKDGQVITSRGIGTAIPFALALIKELVDEAKSAEIAAGIVFTA